MASQHPDMSLHSTYTSSSNFMCVSVEIKVGIIAIRYFLKVIN